MRAHQGTAEPAAVFDLGWGTGLNGARWRSHTGELAGVDLSATMVARARERAIYDQPHQAELTQWLREAPGHRFDLVLACDTLIYFGDLRDPVRLAASQLSPHGVLAFTVERGTRAPFHLSDSGRFTHHPDHVRAAAEAAQLSLVELRESVLRSEYGKGVQGVIAVCRA